MPRRINTKPARTASRSAAGGKTTARKISSKTAKPGIRCKDMRFSVSLVILMGLLTFSLLLLLLSLNRAVTVRTVKKNFGPPPIFVNNGLKKAENQVLDNVSLDFKITVPVRLGEWLYKIGEVKSLTDDSLSNQYLSIYIPIPGKKSNNFDQQNIDILTVRKIDSEEWAVIEKSCQKGKKEICDAAGQLIKNQANPDESDWVYTYTKPASCPQSLEAKCSLADKILESFSLK